MNNEIFGNEQQETKVSQWTFVFAWMNIEIC